MIEVMIKKDDGPSAKRYKQRFCFHCKRSKCFLQQTLLWKQNSSHSNGSSSYGSSASNYLPNGSSSSSGMDPRPLLTQPPTTNPQVLNTHLQALLILHLRDLPHSSSYPSSSGSSTSSGCVSRWDKRKREDYEHPSSNSSSNYSSSNYSSSSSAPSSSSSYSNSAPSSSYSSSSYSNSQPNTQSAYYYAQAYANQQTPSQLAKPQSSAPSSSESTK